MHYFPSKDSAVIITDAQVDYCHFDGKFSRAKEKGGFGIDISNLDKIAHKIGECIERWKSQTTVVLLKTEEEKPQLAIRGTRGHDLHPALNSEGCKIIQKFDRNGFKTDLGESSELETFLKSQGKTNLLHGGFLLSRCVYATLLGGRQLGFSNTLITDLTGNPPPKQEEANMVMRILMGHEEANKITSEEINFL